MMNGPTKELTISLSIFFTYLKEDAKVRAKIEPCRNKMSKVDTSASFYFQRARCPLCTAHPSRPPTLYLLATFTTLVCEEIEVRILI
jgi:hypothetical protein